jgi:glutathione S-transferase
MSGKRRVDYQNIKKGHLMAGLTLYHVAPSRSSIVLWMLEEIGEPYDIHLLSIKRGTNREPAYLAVNPMGKVPALKHGDAIITEVAAVCCYLADAFPKAGLNIPLGDPKRGPYLKWLFFGPGSLEDAIMDRAYPRTGDPPRAALGYGDFDTTMDVVARAVTPGPFLMGEKFTAADVVIGSNLRWATMFKLIPERKEFADYVARLVDRPAAKRAQAKDEELAKV